MENFRDEIVDLNVGGKRMTTTRLTLSQIQGSSLANFCNSPQTPRDKDGLIFLNFNPKHFARILDYLRAKKVSTPDNPAPLPMVSSSEIESFKHLVRHLGLFNEIFPIIKETFWEKNGEVKLDENGTRAVLLSHTTSKYPLYVSEPVYVFGKHVYDSGVFRLKLQIFRNDHMGYSYQNDFNIDIGFINKDIRNSEFSRSLSENCRPNFIGWNFGSNHISAYGMHRNHSGTFGWGSDQRYSWRDGDIIELFLDMNAAILFLNAPGGKQFQIELPKWIGLKLCVRLTSRETGLRILEIRKEG